MTNYESYAILDSQIKDLTSKKDALKTLIIEEMIESGEEKVETVIGKFTISKLKTWTYSPKVAELEEQYKAQKAQEESTGDATFVEKPSLRFTQVKF